LISDGADRPTKNFAYDLGKILVLSENHEHKNLDFAIQMWKAAYKMTCVTNYDYLTQYKIEKMLRKHMDLYLLHGKDFKNEYWVIQNSFLQEGTDSVGKNSEATDQIKTIIQKIRNDVGPSDAVLKNYTYNEIFNMKKDVVAQGLAILEKQFSQSEIIAEDTTSHANALIRKNTLAINKLEGSQHLSNLRREVTPDQA
jgi:hypothetical protein